jgi:hypothetical protein
MYVIAEFEDRRDLENAIVALKDGGFTVADLSFFSQQPLELRSGILDRPTNMSLVAVLGAILLGGAATAFVYYAQHNYKLVTGGMPTFSLWGTGVITYEMTMLGGVLATFACFLWESGLFRKKDGIRPQTSLVYPKTIHLRVRCAGIQDSTQQVLAIALLKGAGATALAQKASV